jgi:hypothetical protein
LVGMIIPTYALISLKMVFLTYFLGSVPVMTFEVI